MHEYMYLVPFLFAFSIATFVLLVMRYYALQLGLLDYPAIRKQHIGVVPLVGGFSIFIGGWCGISVVSMLSEVSLWPLFVASMLVFGVGVQDDRSNLSIKSRVITEVMAVVILMLWMDTLLLTLGDLFGFGGVELGWFAFPITVFAMVGVINALNMIDGIDGLAGSIVSIAVVAMGGMALMAGRTAEAWVAFIFFIALIPYLLCNLGVCGVDRKVFLGDSGSMLSGFILAWLAIELSQPNEYGQAVFAPITALWLVAIPLIDAVAIMVRRLLKGQSPFYPDRDHIHHIVMRMGFKDRHALFFIVLSALVLATVGLWMEFFGVAESTSFTIFLGISLLYIVLLQRIWKVIRVVKKLFMQARLR